MSEAKLAYIAALVDTLGKLSTRVVTRDELPVVTIQGKYEILEWLAVVSGVKLIKLDKSYSRHQCTEHCPDKHMAIESFSYRWQLVGARAVVLLEAIEPYLKLQAFEARRLIRLSTDVAFKPDTIKDMKMRLLA
jgi:hypothetical protein